MEKSTKIAIIGAGQVGATLGLFILQKGLGDVVLVDCAEGLAKGKATDLTQAGMLFDFKNSILGTDSYGDIKGADITVVTAGLPRKPGMTRLDLLKKNSEIVGSVVNEIVRHAPESIILMVTNPLDVMTYLAYKRSGFPAPRVLGQAGVLDTSRFKYYFTRSGKVAHEKISAVVLGGHGDSMVPVISQAKVDGQPLENIVTQEEIAGVIEKTRGGGGTIVKLLKTGGAFYAPAASILTMLDAIIRDTGEILPVSTYLDGEYGLKDIYIGVPARLGRGGVSEVVEIELTEEEKKSLHKSASAYREFIAEIL